MAAGPRYQLGSGGIARTASWVSRPTSAPVSARSSASTNASTSWRTRSSPKEAERPLLIRIGVAARQALPGPLQRAGHRRHRRTRLAGDLGGGESEHLSQQQRRPLRCWQRLQRRDEGELQALALVVAGLRRRRRSAPAQLAVGVGLHPCRLGQRSARPAPRHHRRAVGNGSSRRERRSATSSAALVAILYSQARRLLRPSKPGNACQARSNAS